MAGTSGKTWDWAAHVNAKTLTRDHLFKAYQLDREGCSATSCKRNCIQKPKCIYNLGEKRWFLERDYDVRKDLPDPESIGRTDNFVGLRNLGATCYVNSLLQLLFHNSFLRKAIYLWNPEEDPKEVKKSCMKSEDEGSSNGLETNFNPMSVVGHLQSIFARLQFGNVSCIDPSHFIRSLDLDIYQQQDAQEFCKLFLSLLEEDLATQTNPYVKTIVQDEFQGEYAYITTCMTCQSESRSPSSFYELTLNIEDVDRVEESLKQFITAETLEGDNAYSCSVCTDRTMANRRIALIKLPPTLNIQLLRFVFDRKKGVRRKLNNLISFPENLNMLDYMTSCSTPVKATETKPVIYNLRAILQHFGKTAHSGHYVAHIKDVRKNVWYKFNDEHVELIEGGSKFRSSVDTHGSSQPEVEIIESTSSSRSNGRTKLNDLHVKKTASSNRRSKQDLDRLTSSNAYMLVYQRADREVFSDSQEDWESLLPLHVRQLLSDEKSKFTLWIKEHELCRKLVVDRLNQRKAEVLTIYGLHSEFVTSSASTSPSSAKRGRPRLEIVTKDFLTSWLKCDAERGPQDMDLSDLLCSHNHLKLGKANYIKVVPVAAADIIFGRKEKFERKGSEKAIQVIPRPMTENDLCFDCVHDEIIAQQKTAEIAEDAKVITEIVKINSLTGICYFVGNESFRKWKSLAKEAFQIPSYTPESKTIVNGNGQCDDIDLELQPTPGVSRMDSQDSNHSSETRFLGFKFNEDILCHHNKLNNETSKRKAVPSHVWEIFRKYFPAAPTFTTRDEICPECRVEEDKEEARKALLSTRASTEKEALKNVYNGKSRPNLFDDDDDLVNVTANHSNERTVGGGGVKIESDDDSDGEVSFLSSTSPCHSKKKKVLERKERQPNDDHLRASLEASPSLEKRNHSNSAGTIKTKKQYYLVSMKFIRKWRSFLDNPSRSRPPDIIDNSGLLCDDHKDLLYPVVKEENSWKDPPAEFLVVSETEWESLKSHYACDHEICVQRVPGGDQGDEKVITRPPHCSDCYKGYLLDIHQRKLKYENETIYVTRIVKEDPSETGQQVSSKTAVCNRSRAFKDENDYKQGPPAAKKSRFSKDDITSKDIYHPPTSSAVALSSKTDGGCVRRSNRHKKSPDQKEFVVSSTQTLKCLRVMIMEWSRLATFEQELTLNSVVLDGNEKTLADLNLLPGSFIELRAYENSSTDLDIEGAREAGPESGFKGTLLSSRR